MRGRAPKRRCDRCGHPLPYDHKANAPYPWPRHLACELAAQRDVAGAAPAQGVELTAYDSRDG